jgi:hypothetical protein
VHDAIEFERRGIPATVVITEAFRATAEFQFRARGMPGHAYVELPHPISNLPPDEMSALARRSVDQIARQLTG